MRVPGVCVRVPDLLLRGLGFFRSGRRRQFSFGQADAVQNRRDLGQPRRLDADVDFDPGAVRGHGRDHGTDHSARTAFARGGGAGFGRRGLPCVLDFHLKPVRAAKPDPAGRPGPQSAVAGSRPGQPSAVSLSRLCWLLDRVFLRHRRAAARARGRGLGALCAPLGAGRVGVSHHRHRHRFAVGLLRIGLGRVVVLGPGRERLADAVAARHRAVALGAGDGAAPIVRALDACFYRS